MTTPARTTRSRLRRALIDLAAIALVITVALLAPDPASSEAAGAL